MAPGPVSSSIRRHMSHYGFTQIEPPRGPVQSCAIEAANLWRALKDGVLPPCETLTVHVSRTHMDTLPPCPPEALAQIKTISFQAASAGVESRSGMSRAFQQWVETLPVEHVRFNKTGFAPMAIEELKRRPALKDRLIIHDDAPYKSRKGPPGPDTLSLL